MQIKSVDFLLTFKCPAKCKHCSYKAGPERKGHIDLKDAEGYLEELVKIQPLESITVHGGEPFLCFEQLKGIMKKAKELNLPQRGVITNSYWAKTQVVAKEKLIELKEAGLTRITFSFDAFHQEYIPVENVKNAIISAVNIGFDKLWVDSYFLGGLNADNIYNNSTRNARKVIENLKESDKFEINNYKADFEGRGAELVEYVEPKAEIPSGRCPQPFWIGGELKSPTTIEIDCEGNVTLCPGICIGNTKNQSLGKIIQEYNYSSHPILSKIVKEGPIGLLKTARIKGFKQQTFADECHLCYEVRKFLSPHYPQHLAPASCY
ncbi:MAG: radical SAM protein [Candidatus Hodarchaeota archaeon]